MMKTTRVSAHLKSTAALALLGVLACDSPPPRAAADLAPDSAATTVVEAAIVPIDTASFDAAPLDSVPAAAEPDPAAEPPIVDEPVQPGPPVGPEDFRVGVEPVDASQRVPEPEDVRALYINAYTAGSSARMDALIGLANRTEINAFVIDIKEADGQVTYRSSVPLVDDIGANRIRPIRDVQGLLTRLRENGIYPIARIVVFKDPTLARARPDWAIQTAEHRVWRDHHGEIWVDPYNRNVWEYNLALAREAVALGFAEVQWDYVRFPDVPGSYMRTAVYPAREGRHRTDAIREFLSYTQEVVNGLGVPLTADVFGVATSASHDVGIGQLWEKMYDVTDVLLPMVYPSHYWRGSFGIQRPNAEPYHIVRIALGHAVRRNRAIDDPADIRPWLQDFTLGNPPYDAAHVRAQIQAVYDVGLTEWVLWNASSRYTRGALADEYGNVPPIEGLAALLEPLPGNEPAAGDSLAPADTTVTDSIDELEYDDDGPLGVPAAEI